MSEIFPVLAGVFVGIGSLRVRSIRTRFFIITALSIILGFLATVVSGESAIGWEFLYVDIPLVAGSSVAVLAAARAYRKYGGMGKAMWRE